MPNTLLFGPTPYDSLIVTLSMNGGQTPVVYSVHVVTGEMRKSYCFQAGKQLDSVLAPVFVRSFLPILDRFWAGSREPMEADYAFSMPGTAISGLRIVDKAGEFGEGAVKLHFKRYIGDATHVMLFEQSIEVAPATVRERVAVEVLRDIVSPIFDLLALSNSGSKAVFQDHGDAIQARLNRMAAQQDEIEFYTGLLKRYVAGCQQDADTAESILNDQLEKRIG